MTARKALFLALAVVALTVVGGPSAGAATDDCSGPQNQGHNPAPSYNPANQPLKPGQPFPVTPCVTVQGLDTGPVPVTPEFPLGFALPAAGAAGVAAFWLLRGRRQRLTT